MFTYDTVIDVLKARMKSIYCRDIDLSINALSKEQTEASLSIALEKIAKKADLEILWCESPFKSMELYHAIVTRKAEELKEIKDKYGVGPELVDALLLNNDVISESFLTSSKLWTHITFFWDRSPGIVVKYEYENSTDLIREISRHMNNVFSNVYCLTIVKGIAICCEKPVDRSEMELVGRKIPMAVFNDGTEFPELMLPA